jgi:biopolymer transport protein ExbB
MSKQGSSFKEALQNIFAVSASLIAFVISYLLFVNVMGNPVNFEGGNPQGHALQGNYLGIVYKGGAIVPVLMTCVLTLFIFVIERLITYQEQKVKAD